MKSLDKFLSLPFPIQQEKKKISLAIAYKLVVKTLTCLQCSKKKDITIHWIQKHKSFCIILALNVFTSLYVCFRLKTNIKIHKDSKIMTGEKNCDMIRTIITANKNLRKTGLVTKIRNWNSVISSYLFNFQLNKDLHIDTIGPKWNPTKKSCYWTTELFLSHLQLNQWYEIFAHPTPIELRMQNAQLQLLV